MAGSTPGPGAGDDGDGRPEDPSGAAPDAAPRGWLHPSELGPRLDRLPEPPSGAPHGPRAATTRTGRALPLLATAAVAVVATLGVTRVVQSTGPTETGPRVGARQASPGWSVVPVRAMSATGVRVATGLCVRGGVVTAADAVAGAAVVSVATSRGSVRARIAASDPGSGLAFLMGASCPAGRRLASTSATRNGEPVALLTARRPTHARLSWARVVDTRGAVASTAGVRTGTLVRSDPLAAPAGAPVIDRRGALVAIVVATDGSRLVAAPSNLIARVVAQFAAGEPVRAGWLGVELDLAGTVVRVQDGSPASRAGISSGDTVYALDGHRTATVDLVLGALQAHAPGDRLAVTLERDGRTREVSARLGVPPIG
ncbi:MAG: PDZ domain-containing protein [Actinomycetes bacterium]